MNILTKLLEPHFLILVLIFGILTIFMSQIDDNKEYIDSILNCIENSILLVLGYWFHRAEKERKNNSNDGE